MAVSGDDGAIDATEEFRLCIGAAEATEGLRMKEVSSGKSGRFGVEGVVGVLIGDCGWSGILNGAFISDSDEFLASSEITCGT
jgi:hypothetical protein